ncbi:MAG: hypothetical protein IKA08_04835 [Alphaproteobacteria bacterium]|nr:hypothetical protein [Alphaproteobacteria bacterium]
MSNKILLAGRIVALYNTDGAISETISNPTRVAEKVKNQPKMECIGSVFFADGITIIRCIDMDTGNQ